MNRPSLQIVQDNTPPASTPITVFRNKGEIDIDAIMTFGINAKDEANKNPIGFFGTGLKYAIAILLRNNISLEIWSGEKKLEFTAKEKDFRGKSFSIICMNDQQLGFTTELGKTWELWQAFRELYSNCMDEFGDATSGPDDMYSDFKGEAGFTTIIVHGGEFGELYQSKSEIFIDGDQDDERICSMPAADVYPGPSERVFFRGIRVGEYEKPFKFKYNIKSHIWLTENRTVQYHFDMMNAIRDAVVQSDNKEFIEKILTIGDNYQEKALDFSDCEKEEVSQTFYETVAELKWARKAINSSANSFYESSLDAKQRVTFYRPSEREREIYDVVLSYLDFLGIDATKYKVHFVETLGDGTFIFSEKDEVYISKSIFTQSTRKILNLVYKQFIYLDLEKEDGESGMVAKLIAKIIRQAERIRGETLEKNEEA